MRSNYTGYVTPAEWRWVVVVSSALVLLALTPFLWVVLSSPSRSQWQFMGAIHNYSDAAAEIAKITLGARGTWLTSYNYTPEPHTGVLMDMLYPALGQLSRPLVLSPIILFHVARVGASMFMYFALYHLAAAIWMRIRTRRIFFLLAVVGAGLGWLFAPLTQFSSYLDLVPSGIYPFHTTLLNVHLPLVIASQSLIASAIIGVLRPGFRQNPSVINGGMTLFLFGLALTMLYPQALLPIIFSFIGLLMFRARRSKGPKVREWRWALWFGVPALPLTVYYLTVFVYNPVVSDIWMQRNQVAPPNLGLLLLSLGLPLMIALPGLYRAFRRFEPDGNQFMLGWLLTMVVLAYAAPVIRVNFLVGLMIPLAYFGARSIEDFWFSYISRVWRYRVLTLVFPVMAISHLYVLYAPVAPISASGRAAASGMLLQGDYAQTFRWLAGELETGTVVLAAPAVSLWIPSWSGMDVVSGHATDTLNSRQKNAAVRSWYTADDFSECSDLLEGKYTQHERYWVSYVLYGPQEAAYGQSPCLSLLTPVGRVGRVIIYRNDFTVPE